MPRLNAETVSVGHAMRTNKCLQLAEIGGVFAIGAAVLFTFTAIFGAGPLASVVGIWIANLTMLVVIYLSLRFHSQSWGHLGLNDCIFEYKSVCKIVLQSIPVFIFAILAFVIGAVVMANIVGMPEVADMSKYDYLRGNLILTLLALASVYFVSAFAEEVIYRGYLITRLIELGGRSKTSRCCTVALSSLIFGVVHSDWGLSGMVQASCMGVALGVSYLVVKRNLWVTILAHAYMDTILILQMYIPIE